MYGHTAVDAMRIVAWIFLFYFISSLSNYTLIAHGEQRKILIVNAVVAAVNIVGNIIFIPYFSFIGSAWVTLATQLLLVIITWYLVRRSYDNRHQILQSVFFIGMALASGWLARTGVALVELPALSS